MSKNTLKLPKITHSIFNEHGKVIKTNTFGPFLFKKEMGLCNSHNWRLKDKKGKEWGVIQTSEIDKNDEKVRCVSYSQLDHQLQGLGIGSKMYSHLIDRYRVLESDPSGSTSPKAAKVWQRMGAKKIKVKTQYGTVTRYRMTSKSYIPPQKDSIWTSFISNMMSWLKPVKLIPVKYLLTIGLNKRFQKR